MGDILGQFLRYVHLIIIVLLNEGVQMSDKYPTGGSRGDDE
jgi:hypothetical protein